MKKLLVLCVMLASTAFVSAQQLKTIDVKANLRNIFGIGGGVTMEVFNKLDFAPSFNYYFPDKGTCFTIDGDLHLNIELPSMWQIYPLAGITYYQWREDGHSSTRLGMNIGVGTRFELSDRFDFFAEGKYQCIKNHGDTYVTAGISLKLP